VTSSIEDLISNIVAAERAIATESLVRKVVDAVHADESEVRSMIVRMTLGRRIRLTTGWTIRPALEYPVP
jgi:hypothetical protein